MNDVDSRLTEAEAAWEERKYAVGKAMHEGWKRQKIRNGFADHAWRLFTISATGRELRTCYMDSCYLPVERHHADMIPWEELPPEQQAINYSGGREGYIMGYLDAAAQRKACCS